jgi:predicted RNA-binding protein with RPS1 domain
VDRSARPQFGRRATRVTRGPQEPVRARLPQPDVEEELAQQDALGGEAPVPAWQRGKLAERAEAIEKRLAERRAAGENVPPSALDQPEWQPGDLVEGTVKSITDFGAFLDLGGIDALLHVSQMAWQHVRHPSQVVQIGEKLQVRVLEVDESSGRVSVGLKQLSADPWLSAADKYEVGRLVRGRVSGVKEYGVFVELEPGIFGLLHVSNIFQQPWGHHPGERYKLDQDVEVVVSKIDPDMRRLAFVLHGTPIEATAVVVAEVPVSATEEPADDEEAAEAAFRFREGDDEN